MLRDEKMVISPSSNDINLSELLQKVANGNMQLPEFQRSWTWDDNRIRGIIASLTQGYPMGAIMRLQYGNPDICFKYRLFEGVTTATMEPDFLVLDGQQRLTSIYQALWADKPVLTKTEKGKVLKRFYYLPMKDCLNDDIDRFDAVLSIPEDKKVKKNFDRDIVLDLSDKTKEYELQMFPVNIVYNITALTQWITGYMQYYQNDVDAQNLFNRFQIEVLQTITQYKLPVITLDKSTPREAVCKVFENVNTGGVALTVFELVTATFATYHDPNTGDGFDLRKDWLKCQEIIRGIGDTLRTDLLDGIDETTFLTAVTLYTSYQNKKAGITGMVSCKKKDVLNLKYTDYQNNRDAVLSGFQMAREFLLTYQYIFRRRDLPYATQLIPLATIFAIIGSSKGKEPNTTKILTQWYWCGILGEMYGGANETRYANDVEDMVDAIMEQSYSVRTINAAFFSATRLLTLQTRLSAAYKGIMALLYKEKCQDFMNKTTIDLVNSMVQSPDIHHIFPEAYCKKNNIPREKYNSIVNKTPILPETNRYIGGDAPSVYITRILNKVNGLTPSEMQIRIESHLIDYDALSSDDFDTYFIDRAKNLLNLIDNAMGKKVADRDSEETIRQFGGCLS